VILTDIYPAREQPIPGITSKIIFDNLKPGVEKQMIRKEEVPDFVKSRDFDVLVILGAGDLDNYAEQITQIIEEKI
jgi:UDP-N-acetylmuramate--alanine ligase